MLVIATLNGRIQPLRDPDGDQLQVCAGADVEAVLEPLDGLLGDAASVRVA